MPDESHEFGSTFRVDRVPGVAVDLQRRPDDTAVGDLEDVCDRGVLHARVCENRHVRNRSLDFLEVGNRRRLAGDCTRNEDGVGNARKCSTPRPVGQTALVERVSKLGR